MSKFVVTCDWTEVPHLSPEVQKEMYEAIQPYQRAARTKGIPTLGAGVIYPFGEDTLKFPATMELPRHWPRCFGLDTDAGAGFTACVWGAWDREQGMVYIYRVYKSPARETAVHIAAVKSGGAWIPGVGDAKSLVVTEQDSIQLIQLYKNSGVDIEMPDKTVEAGIQDVYDLMAAGRLKIREDCGELFSELRLYRRDDKGKIVKTNDHAADSLRYLVRSGLKRAKVQPDPKPDAPPTLVYDYGNAGLGWMG